MTARPFSVGRIFGAQARPIGVHELSNVKPPVAANVTAEQYAEAFGVGIEAARRSLSRLTAPVVMATPLGLQWRESNEEQLARLRRLLVVPPVNDEWATSDDIIGDLNRMAEVLRRPMGRAPNYARIGHREFVDGVEVVEQGGK